MKAGESVFLDTNILVYAVERDNPLHKKATALMDRIITGKLSTCLSPQIIGELYSTITNPRKIMKACQPDEAVDIVRNIWEMNTILKIFPKQETLELTLRLAERYELKSLDFFDAQIVATMLDNEVTMIYTVNEDDFVVFEEIKVLNPLKLDTR